MCKWQKNVSSYFFLILILVPTCHHQLHVVVNVFSVTCFYMYIRTLQKIELQSQWSKVKCHCGIALHIQTPCYENLQKCFLIYTCCIILQLHGCSNWRNIWRHMNQNINITATMKMHKANYIKKNSQHIEAVAKGQHFAHIFKLIFLLKICS